MRLSRGLWIMGLAGTLFTLLNVYFTVVIYGLWCIDTCAEDVGSILVERGSNSLTQLLLVNVFLIPCLSVIFAVWIWMLVDLRRQQAMRLFAFGCAFPVFALVTWVVVTFLTSSHSQKALAVYTVNLWYGSFALALWPLLVTLVAIFWRPARPVTSPSMAASG